jgi:hypothetical protein
MLEREQRRQSIREGILYSIGLDILTQPCGAFAANALRVFPLVEIANRPIQCVR